LVALLVYYPLKNKGQKLIPTKNTKPKTRN
jgi:hypothetical protein